MLLQKLFAQQLGNFALLGFLLHINEEQQQAGRERWRRAPVVKILCDPFAQIVHHTRLANSDFVLLQFVIVLQVRELAIAVDELLKEVERLAVGSIRDQNFVEQSDRHGFILRQRQNDLRRCHALDILPFTVS